MDEKLRWKIGFKIDLCEYVFFDCVGKFVVIVEVIVGEWNILDWMILFVWKIFDWGKVLLLMWECFIFV